MISALTGEGIEALLAAIDARFAAKDEVLTLEIPPTAGRLMSWLFDHAEVLRHESTEEGAMRARFRIDPILKGKLDAQLKRAGLSVQSGLRQGGGLSRS